jgi:hypothetical protein
MNRTTSPSSIESQAAHREYDDGDPGTILIENPSATAIRHRAGDWAQSTGETYYDDGEAGTVSG